MSCSHSRCKHATKYQASHHAVSSTYLPSIQSPCKPADKHQASSHVVNTVPNTELPVTPRESCSADYRVTLYRLVTCLASQSHRKPTAGYRASRLTINLPPNVELPITLYRQVAYRRSSLTQISHQMLSFQSHRIVSLHADHSVSP